MVRDDTKDKEFKKTRIPIKDLQGFMPAIAQGLSAMLSYNGLKELSASILTLAATNNSAFYTLPDVIEIYRFFKDYKDPKMEGDKDGSS